MAKFNPLDILKYLEIGMNILEDYEMAKNNLNNAENYANMLSQMALQVDPDLANNAQFQRVQKILAAFASVESGSAQQGVLASFAIQSNGVPMEIDLVLKPKS